jgi:large subunit ribosomal protein L18
MVKKNNVVRREKRARRVLAIRKKLYGTTERPRLAVFRSLNQIYAQIIDDTTGKTLVSMSTIAKDFQMEKCKKVEMSFQVGLKLGEKAKAAGITKVSFDRSGYKYHGRVKALADGARKAGLEF